MNDHTFCQALLCDARAEAARNRVELPKRITAISGTTVGNNRQFFVESKGRKGEYVTAHCAYEAKSKFIHALLDAKAAQ